jgi:hypothetical protein
MLLKKRKFYLPITLLAILISKTNVYCQANSEALLYNWFDNKIGKENLGINNGPLHINSYLPFYKSDSYYLSDKFTSADVSYDGQFYYDQKLKYDIYKDILILKPNGEYNYMGLILIKEKIDFFSINGKKFINLNFKKAILPEFINGYYELILTTEKFIFYIKHHKDISKIIIDTNILNEFEENNQFVLNYKDKFFQINSKKDLTNLFPEYRNKINEYYLLNKEKEKINRTQFMENLMIYINNFLPNLSN